MLKSQLALQPHINTGVFDVALTEQPHKLGENVRMKGVHITNGNGTQLMDVFLARLSIVTMT